MRKAKQIANEICLVYADAIMQNNWQLFTKKLSDVFKEVAVNDVLELSQMRNVKTDNGLIPIFKEQRQKYNSVCKIVNSIKNDLLCITDFDEVIKEVYPEDIYKWYYDNILVLKPC